MLICAMFAVVASATINLSPYKGVYASNTAEAVITDSVCILFFQKDSTMQAIVEAPSINLRHMTVFAPNGNVTFPTDIAPLSIEQKGKNININGLELEKVEDISTVGKYEMAACSAESEVGKCLQQWRLGVRCWMFDNRPSCEINTNRHMFVYTVSPDMVYIRAAATRNNNNGTLFFQNIRMMKNMNSGEYTMYIMPNNSDFVKKDLEIDNSKFQPNSCTFNDDGGIYWSLISFKPDVILINGCGETYQVTRPAKNAGLTEWIQYEAY